MDGQIIITQTTDQTTDKIFYQNLLKTISKYPFDDAQEPIRLLKNQITQNQDLRDRKNFEAHLTSKTFIFSEGFELVLLLHHKGVNKWLQAGGHIDLDDETMVGGANREGEEETSLSNLTYQPIDTNNLEIPIDLDIHPIPANSNKSEPAHWHYGFSYVFVTNFGQSLVQITIDPSESLGYKRISFEEFEQDTEFMRVANKVKKYFKPNLK